jgi:serine/threonine protein kinase
MAWDEVKQLFAAALEQPATLRDAWVADADAAPAVRAEVRELLACLDAAEDFLEWPSPGQLSSVARMIATESRHGPRFGPGDKLSRYEILDLLGVGGMGEVYRARDTRLNRIVVLKVQLADTALLPEARARLEREARAVSSLSHPHVCALYDIGQDDGVDFLVMEHLEGETLAVRLGRGALPVDDVLTCARQIADALHALHQLGIVHRDLKPANIMLTAAGAKLLDFGIAKPMSHESIAPTMSGGPASVLTQHGELVGTAAYMAPEQIQGGLVDARTDIFSFGAVLYEMATARKAFAGEDRASVFDAILVRDVPAMRDVRRGVPRAIERVARKCVAKDPAARYQTAADLQRDLTIVAESRRRTRRNQWLVAAASVVTASVGLAWWLTPAAARSSVRLLERVDGVNDLKGLSPDGTKAVFISYDQGQNLGVRDFGTTQATLLTHFGWTDDRVNDPIWSPDGRRIAYMQTSAQPDATAELRIATLDGVSVVIFRNEANPGRRVRPAAWLPGGGTLLVVLEQADRTSALGLIPTAGGEFTSLKPLQWTGGNPDMPAASPDGRFVTFADGATAARDIHVLSVDGRTAYRITDHPGDDRQPRWSPDGRHIVFISDRFGTDALWRVEVKEGQSVKEPFRIKDGMQGAELIGWAGGGLAYVQPFRADDIYTVSVDPSTGQPRAEPRQLSYRRTGANGAPVFSPDNTRLAIISASPAERDRRYVVVLPQDGGDPQEFLIPTTRYDSAQGPYDLRWFGDGTGLGFSGTDARGEPVLFRLELRTGTWRTDPLPVKGWTRIEWNADGSRYIYARHGNRDETPAIVEHDLSTGRERLLFEDAKHVSQFRGLVLSPDRRFLAFTVSRVEAARVVFRAIVVDTSNGQATTVAQEIGGQRVETAVTFGKPAWSPDGRALLVPRTLGPDMWPELRVVSLDGAQLRSLTLDKSFVGDAATGNPGLAIRDVSWSADGTRMAFVLSSSRLDAWMIDNLATGR